MTLNQRFLESRVATNAALWMIGLAVTAWTLLWVVSDSCVTLLIQTITPVGAAVVVGLGARSPFGEVEAASGSPLTRLRLVHLGGLLACGAVLLLLAGTADPGVDTITIMLRNIAGFAGMALLAGALINVASAWLIPFTYGLVTFLAAMPDHQAGAWAWPVRPADHVGSAVVATLLLVAGLVVASRNGAKAD